ncbi:MAG: aminotransferase class IV [Verrucomicrobiota bacterium]
MSQVQSNHAPAVSATSPSRPPTVWLNGDLVAADAAQISPFDHGLLTGDGVFETLKTYGGKPFEMERHYLRMQHAAKRFGIAVPSLEELGSAVDQVLKANDKSDADARLRITVTSGVAPLGSEQGDSGPTAVIAVGGLPQHPEVGDAITVEFCRNDVGALTGLKTTSYGDNVIALAQAHKAGVNEAIFPNTKGNLCEGTGSNVFVVYDGQLITPPLSCGGLAGVTRAVVLELCEKSNISVKEIDTPITQLGEAEEVFLTSTLREVMPLASIDGRQLPESKPIGEQVRALFNEFTGKQ